MQYKAKEVSQILNIPIDTLRYFEKIGVIHPQINEKNHYRYYEAWDINFIFDYLNYRKMDYSSQESIQFIRNASLEEQIEKIEEKIQYYEQKKNYYDLLCQKNNELYQQIHHIKEKLNQIEICHNEPFYYLVYRHNNDFSKEKEIHAIKSEWLQHHPFLDNIVFIPGDTILKSSSNEYYWSLALSKQYFDEFHFQQNEYIHYIPSQLCIKIVIDAKGKGQFHYGLLNAAFSYIEKHRFKINGDPFGKLLIRNNDENGFHRFIEFYIPITE